MFSALPATNMFGAAPAQPAFGSTPSFGAQPQAGLSGNEDAQRVITEAAQRMQQTKAVHTLDYVAYSYVIADNPQQITQVINQPYQQSVHMDSVKWQAAKAHNPDPLVAYPMPIVGFQQLEQRALHQKRLMEAMIQQAEQAKAQFQNLKTHIQSVTMADMDKCRSTQKSLSSQLVSVTRDLELYAIRNAKGSSDITRQKQVADKIETVQTKLSAMTRKLAGMQTQLKALKSDAKERAARAAASPADILNLEELEMTALARAKASLRRITDAKFAENVQKRTTAEIREIFNAYLTQGSSRPIKINRAQPAQLCPSTEKSLIDSLLAKHTLSPGLLLQVANSSVQSVKVARHSDDARELWDAAREIACGVSSGLRSLLVSSVTSLEKKWAASLCNFVRVRIGTGSVDPSWATLSSFGKLRFDDSRFPDNNDHIWFLAFCAVRCGWKNVIEEIAADAWWEQRAPGLSTVCTALAAGHLLLTPPAPSPQPSVYREILIALATDSFFAAGQLPQSTAEDWLWFGLSHAASGNTEEVMLTRLMRVRRKIEGLPEGYFGKEGELQLARIQLLCLQLNTSLTTTASVEPGIAAHLALTLGKSGLHEFLQSKELLGDAKILGEIVMKHVSPYPIEDQLRHFSILPTNLRTEVLEIALLENTGDTSEDLMGFINRDGSHKPGLLEKSMKDKPDEFKKICHKAAAEAIRRGKYRPAIRLYYLSGDRFSFLDVLERTKQLVNGAMSKAGLTKSALDIDSLREDVKMFEEISRSRR